MLSDFIRSITTGDVSAFAAHAFPLWCVVIGLGVEPM